MTHWIRENAPYKNAKVNVVTPEITLNLSKSFSWVKTSQVIHIKPVYVRAKIDKVGKYGKKVYEINIERFSFLFLVKLFI